MRIGNVGVSWSFTKHPFSLLVRTTYFVMGDPLEGPKYVRKLTHWLWLIVSWDAPKHKLEQAKAMWFSPENRAMREQVKAEYEKVMKQEGSDVQRVH